MYLYIILGVIILIIIYAFVLYNSFIKLNNKVREAFSTMDVYLKKRWDLIPNLVDTVKEYLVYEEHTLKELVELRSSIYDKMSDDEKIKINEKLGVELPKIMMLKEAYPELKANENFKNLSVQLTKVEDDLANARKYYNGVIRMYNNKVEMFPNNIFAHIFMFKSKKMFEATDIERENVKIEL